MPKLTRVTHEFVRYIPRDLRPGTVYVSIENGTAMHRCCCGCGSEVVTPLTPVDWKLTYDGETVSLDPSIGSWSLACRSHYWIEKDKVRWSRSWTDEEIAENRDRDRSSKRRYFALRTGLRDGNR